MQNTVALSSLVRWVLLVAIDAVNKSVNKIHSGNSVAMYCSYMAQKSYEFYGFPLNHLDKKLAYFNFTEVQFHAQCHGNKLLS